MQTHAEQVDFGSLVIRAIQNDPMATELLFNHLRLPVNHVCRRLCGYECADDLTQETLLTVHLKLNTLRQPQKVVPWAIKIARNFCFLFFRQKQKRSLREIHIPNLEQLPERYQRASRPTQQEVLEWLHEGEIYRRNFWKMEPKYRQVLVVAARTDSYEVIANHLGVPVSTVRTRLHRARKKLGLPRSDH